MLEPILNDVVIRLTLEEAVDRVGGYSYYSMLFIGAFRDSTLSSERMALAQFVRSIMSTETKLDIRDATDFANFMDGEKAAPVAFMKTLTNETVLTSSK